MKNEVMPIGKYKGMTIDEVYSVDPKYFEWLSTQDWFKEKYDSTYNLIINIFNPEKNECTPEHNKLQFLFLNDNIKIDIAKRFFNLKTYDLKIYKKDWEKILPNFIPVPRLMFREVCFEECGFDVCFMAIPVFKKISFEEIQNLFNYPIQLSEFNFQLIGEKYLNIVIKDNNIEFNTYMDEHGLKFYIEIKPTISDDFPNILRQIKKNRNIHKKYKHNDRIILAYNNFSVSNLSFEEVKTFFLNENIYLYKITQGE